MREKLDKYIEYNDILRFLHYKKKEVDLEIKKQVDCAIEVVFENSNFLYTSEKKKIIYKDEDKLILENKLELPYKSLTKLFKNSSVMYIVACTLGHNIPRLIKRELAVNPANGVILDSCASVIVDAYAAYLQEQYGRTTSRFSPGYGDVPLESQKLFSGIFNMTKKIGIHLTDGNLMIPEKSIVFLMGDVKEGILGNESDMLSCKTCKRDECSYRKE